MGQLQTKSHLRCRPRGRGWRAQIDEVLHAPQTTLRVMKSDEHLAGERTLIPEMGDLLDELRPGWTN
jgi:hypothetical protein